MSNNTIEAARDWLDASPRDGAYGDTADVNAVLDSGDLDLIAEFRYRCTVAVADLVDAGRTLGEAAAEYGPDVIAATLLRLAAQPLEECAK